MIAKFKKRKKTSSFQTIFFSILLGVLVLIVVGFLIFENLKTSQRRTELINRIENLKIEIQELEKEKEYFKSGISQVEIEEYVEKVAREDLNLQKEGEKAVGFTLSEEESRGEEEKNYWNPKEWWKWLKSKF